MSIGENEKTCFGSKDCNPKYPLPLHYLNTNPLSFLTYQPIGKYTCFQVVTDESANPGWRGRKHRFVKLKDENKTLKIDHRTVVKPSSRSSEQYQLLLEFVRNVLNNKDDESDSNSNGRDDDDSSE